MFSSHTLYQPQVVAALTQFSSLLNTARTSTNIRTYRSVNRKHRKEIRPSTQTAENCAEKNEDGEKKYIEIEDILRLPAVVSLEELCAPSSIARKLGESTHVSAETFFENKSGFPEVLLDSNVQENHRKLWHSEPFKKLLHQTHSLFFQQTRGFKTRRSGATGIGSARQEDTDQTLFTDFKDVKEQVQDKILGTGKHATTDKLKKLLKENSSDEIQKKIKVAFAEGYIANDEKKGTTKAVSTYLVRALMFCFFAYVIFNFLMSSGGKNIGLSIITKEPHEVAPEDVHVTFDDVKGIDTAKDELMEVVDYLKDPKKYTSLGAKLPKGVLLVGPPGIGKTLLARAVAGEAGVPFFQCSGSEFDEMFVGLGAKRVRDLFKKAKLRGSCVIFIDEIDSVGASRTSSELHPYANQTINQLLAEMDGFSQNDNIIVLGATNRVDQLDKALRRKGRFDVEVRVRPPDLKGRMEILELYLGKVRASPDINLEGLAKGTIGFTGADLSNLVNTAALKAAMDNDSVVTEKNLYWARDKVLMGPENKQKIPIDKVNWVTAVHEAGHTIVAYYTKEADALHKVTIRARGQSLGHTSFIPEDEMYNETKAQLMARMDVSMGGRVAEEVVLGADQITTGASSDFQGATSIASAMVKRLGMSEKIGVRVFGADNQDSGLGIIKVNNDSETIKHEIDLEIKTMLQESYDRAKKIITQHSKQHIELAKMLMKYETLSKEDINTILQGKKLNRKI